MILRINVSCTDKLVTFINCALLSDDKSNPKIQVAYFKPIQGILVSPSES